jgi:16S rRNA (uracil1498-N3)-methyltransferase
MALLRPSKRGSGGVTIPRIHVPRPLKEGNLLELGKENLHYIRSVLRMKKGDRLTVMDGTGWECEAVIDHISKEGASAAVIKACIFREKDIRITLMQSLPKANKMDFIVEKATELGAEHIFSFQSTRSVPRLTPEKADLKLERWQTIAVEASRQCGRADIPDIQGILSFEEALSWPGHGALKLIFWEEEAALDVKQILRDKGNDGMRDISVIIGPEGGFTKEEIAKAGEKGFVSVSLGRQVLKVETAVLAVLSIIQYEKGLFGGADRGEAA